MNKKELIEKLTEKTKNTKTVVTEIVEEMINFMISELKQGNKVTLVGFGSFEVRNRKGRTGRNPRTGEKMELPSGKTPSFLAGKKLKDAVKGRV